MTIEVTRHVSIVPDVLQFALAFVEVGRIQKSACAVWNLGTIDYAPLKAGVPNIVLNAGAVTTHWGD